MDNILVSIKYPFYLEALLLTVRQDKKDRFVCLRILLIRKKYMNTVVIFCPKDRWVQKKERKSSVHFIYFRKKKYKEKITTNLCQEDNTYDLSIDFNFLHGAAAGEEGWGRGVLAPSDPMSTTVIVIVIIPAAAARHGHHTRFAHFRQKCCGFYLIFSTRRFSGNLENYRIIIKLNIDLEWI